MTRVYNLLIVILMSFLGGLCAEACSVCAQGCDQQARQPGWRRQKSQVPECSSTAWHTGHGKSLPRPYLVILSLWEYWHVNCHIMGFLASLVISTIIKYHVLYVYKLTVIISILVITTVPVTECDSLSRSLACHCSASGLSVEPVVALDSLMY